MKTKKLLVFLIILILSISSIFASNWKFVFGDLTQNPEILWGFMPSYFYGGVGYEGLSLIEDDTTAFQVLFGAGYNNRKAWQNPVTGEIMKTNNPLVFNYIDIDWSLRFLQGFLDNPLNPKKDLIVLTFAYEGQYEEAKDSLKVGKDGVASINDYFNTYYGSSNYKGNIYPALNGDRKFLGTQFYLNLKIDSMLDNIHVNNGFLANLRIMWGPKLLNSALDGYASYISSYINAVGSYTLYSYATENTRWFSLVLMDRINFNYTTGDAIPLMIQSGASLGRKVRGFNKNTYNTEFSFINNIDLRIAGPDMGVKGICPRVNLFYDLGYGWGNIMNTKINSGGNYLSSTGVQATVTFFDFIDLGYQVAYLINGNNYADDLKNGNDRVKVSGSFTFFLDF